MEQLAQTFGIDWKLLAFQGINFLVLLFVLKQFLYGPLMRFVEERQRLIRRGVENASLADKSLAETKSKISEEKRRTSLESDKLLAEARRMGEERQATMMREAEARAAELRERAREEAETDKLRILRESQEEIARLSVLAAEKILRS